MVTDNGGFCKLTAADSFRGISCDKIPKLVSDYDKPDGRFTVTPATSVRLSGDRNIV